MILPVGGGRPAPGRTRHSRSRGHATGYRRERRGSADVRATGGAPAEPVGSHRDGSSGIVLGFADRQLADGAGPDAAGPDGAGPDGVLRRAIGDLVAASVLTTFPNTLVAESADLPPRDDLPATVALALDFVARHADLPITPAGIAAHVPVSRRALELAFRDHLATSPAAYLRRYRLARVHAELAAAAPGDGTTVTEVAARWRFPSSSRFAASYREVYREHPSRTLRRPP